MIPKSKLGLGFGLGSLLALALWLNGCAPGAGVDEAAAGVVVPCPGSSEPVSSDRPCGLVCRAVLPIRASSSQLFLVDIKVNDKPVLMVLDTGASRTMLSPAAATRIGLGAGTLEAGRMLGGGGDVAAVSTAIHSIALGHAQVGPGRVYLLPEKQTAAGTGELGFDGMLGHDVLGRYQVDLDFPHQIVRLYEGKLCPGPLPNWPAEVSVMPMTARLGPNLITVDGALDGLPVTTVLDTGWEAIDVGEAIARRLDGARDESKPDRAVRVFGVGPNVLVEKLRRFKALSLGAMTIPDPDIAISPERFAQSLMLVGDPVLSTRRVWIDYPGRLVHFAQPD